MSTNTRHSQESSGGSGVFVTPPPLPVGSMVFQKPATGGAVEVVCSTARRRMDHATSKKYSLFSHTLTIDPTSFTTWPQTTNVHCWHCCHQFDSVPVSIPQTSLSMNARKYYSVYGVFCTINCAKKYLMEKHTHDQPQLLMTLNEVCVEVYGMCPDKVFNAIPAPPRMSLQMFGGDLDITAYRKESLCTHTVLVTPPFVSHAMIVEKYPIAPPPVTGEVSTDDPVVEPLCDGKHVLRGLRRPTHPLSSKSDANGITGVRMVSRFEDFVATKKTVGVSSRPPRPPPTKRSKRAASMLYEDTGHTGGLTSFLKSSRTHDPSK